MSIVVLGPDAWVEFRGEPTSKGLNETTHLAKIKSSDGKLRDCFVKLLPLDSPALLCEAIGWLLAQDSGVSCPNFGAILMVPMKDLRQYVTLPPEFDGIEHCPAWCSEVVNGKSVRQIHKWIFFIARKKCLGSKDAKNIAAFDSWTDLQDRNYGNIIQTGSRYIAIDHESLLHELLWLPTGQGFELRSLLSQAKLHLNQAEFKRFKTEMVTASTQHQPALESSKDKLSLVVSMILGPNSDAACKAILDALSTRAAANWLADSIGVIA